MLINIIIFSVRFNHDHSDFENSSTGMKVVLRAAAAACGFVVGIAGQSDDPFDQGASDGDQAHWTRGPKYERSKTIVRRVQYGVQRLLPEEQGSLRAFGRSTSRLFGPTKMLQIAVRWGCTTDCPDVGFCTTFITSSQNGFVCSPACFLPVCDRK